MATGTAERALEPAVGVVPQRVTGAGRALRALTVIFGGPLLLNLFMVAGVAGSILALLRRPTRSEPVVVRRLLGLGALLAWVYTLAVRPWFLRWGATDEEVYRPLPGDELTPHPVWCATRAVTINAPAAAVWPWLVQIGRGRGGFYSYDWLENLAGLAIHSTDRILPEYQTLHTGDFIAAAPGTAEAGMGWTVVDVEPGRALVLRTGPPAQAARAAARVVSTWVFVIEPRDEHSSRLLARGRLAARPRLLAMAVMALLELPYFIMERRMLLGIKARAERSAGTG